MVTTFLDHALYIAQTLNAPVFPIIENGRIPAIGGWQHRATTDEAKIRAMWTEHDPVFNVTRVKPYNIGIYTKDRLVLDVDNKKGKNGSKALEDLCVLNDLPDTFTVRTPTGGFHYYFKPSASVGNSNSKLGLGLDVRGDGGLVVGPGSSIVDEIDGRKVERFYEIINGAPVADAPAWLEQLAGQPTVRSADAGKPATMPNGEPLELDTPYARQRAVDWLKGIDPKKRPSTYTAACECKDYGLSALVTLEIMDEHWNGPIHPGMDFEVLAQKVDNAYRYGKRPVGAKSPSADFEEVPAGPVDTAEIPTPRPALRMVSIDDARPFTDRKWIVKDLLPTGAMSVVYGESHSGKTAFTMALGFHVAAGSPFAGRKVSAGAVVYIAAEAGQSAEARACALRMHHRAARGAVPFFIVASPIDLCHGDADVKRLVDVIAEQTEGRGSVALIVVDTLSRAMAGGDENGPVDMGKYVRNIDALRFATSAHVLSIHHSGKDLAKGARGHSSLRAATDTEIEVADKVARVTKQRDGEPGVKIGFETRGVPLGRDADGADVTAVVAIPSSAVEDFRDMKSPLVGDDANVMDLLRKAGGKARVNDIRVRFVAERAKRVKDVKPKSHGTEFRRTMKRLEADGYIAKTGDKTGDMIEARLSP